MLFPAPFIKTSLLLAVMPKKQEPAGNKTCRLFVYYTW